MNIFTAIALFAFLSCCLEVCGYPYRSGEEQLEYAASAKHHDVECYHFDACRDELKVFITGMSASECCGESGGISYIVKKRCHKCPELY
ncbi:hypothetical protein GBAR_LOCUS31446 [Geodia barretti]|uniref:Uncharacterized protein n=1 Tax=Geodia barretti TaxID=519541 RepID=A0AA35XN13_GEOBA|nr:hypothetical protein GBAR_LOCUS31446 [Geodia barretti]